MTATGRPTTRTGTISRTKQSGHSLLSKLLRLLKVEPEAQRDRNPEEAIIAGMAREHSTLFIT
jgi:hypothetical protein